MTVARGATHMPSQDAIQEVAHVSMETLESKVSVKF